MVTDMVAKANLQEATAGLLLRPDIYSLTFFGFMVDDHDKNVIESFYSESHKDSQSLKKFRNIQKVVDLLR